MVPPRPPLLQEVHLEAEMMEDLRGRRPASLWPVSPVRTRQQLQFVQRLLHIRNRTRQFDSVIMVFDKAGFEKLTR